MKISRVIGTTSQIVEVFILDTSSTTGGGKTGLVFNTSGLICYYKRNTAASATAVSLVTATVGTWTSSGFKEVDATHMPGVYEIGVPNAALVTGADTVTFMLSGATGAAPCLFEIELTATNNQDGVRGGMTALPASPMALKKNQAYNNFQFVMYNVNGTGATGLTVTATRSIDGAGFSACANSVSEIANGWYEINLATTDLNGLDIALRFSATGALDTNVKYTTQA